MPNYDFRCPTHGVFEARSVAIESGGVETVECPLCGDVARHVWLRPPAMRDGGEYRVRFGGQEYRADEVEAMLAAKGGDDDDSDALWNRPGFEEDFLARLNRNANLSAYGELPPIELPPESQKVFEQGLKE